jgi:hypothetical protein
MTPAQAVARQAARLAAVKACRIVVSAVMVDILVVNEWPFCAGVMLSHVNRL